MKRNNIKVHILAILLVVGILLGQPMSVHADAIWEPYEDNFYSENYMECELYNRDYLTNSKAGYVTVMESPKSSKELAKVENGKEYEISFVWTDKNGDKWGIIELEKDVSGEPVYGWVLMDEMALIYDADSFSADYREEFAEYQGEFDDYEIEDALILWEYPGTEDYAEKITEYINDEAPEYSSLYTDPNGNRWVYFTYYYGYKDRWVCIDAPEAREINVSYDLRKNVPEIYEAVTPEGELNDGSADIPGLGLAASLVAVVVAVTAVLIAVLFRKNGKNPAGK